MNLLELFLVAIGVSMDAFVVAACSGLTMRKVTIKKSLIVVLWYFSRGYASYGVSICPSVCR